MCTLHMVHRNGFLRSFIWYIFGKCVHTLFCLLFHVKILCNDEGSLRLVTCLRIAYNLALSTVCLVD